MACSPFKSAMSREPYGSEVCDCGEQASLLRCGVRLTAAESTLLDGAELRCWRMGLVLGRSRGRLLCQSVIMRSSPCGSQEM